MCFVLDIEFIVIFGVVFMFFVLEIGRTRVRRERFLFKFINIRKRMSWDLNLGSYDFKFMVFLKLSYKDVR